MAIGDDFQVASSGAITYIGGSTNYTVIALHRWLGDLMDNAAASGDDILDITDATASERSTDNIITLKYPYNIDDDAATHLYDGSIIQSTSSGNLGEVIYDGILVFANGGMYLDVIQNGALATNFWTTGLNADAANGISHRFLLKVRTAGVDIDGRKLVGQTREFGYTYSEFKINGTSRGNNVMALTYAADLNNQTLIATIAALADVTNTEGYRAIDVNNDTVDEYYYSEWTRGANSINTFYERIKWVTRRGSVTSIYGKTGNLVRGITHEVTVTGQSATNWSATELISWGTGATAGTGIMFAVDDVNASTTMWIQVLTGIAPSSTVTITGATSGAYATNSGTPTERTLSQPLCGVSTGSALIGAYGFGMVATDLSANDKVFDLTNTQISPPNYVTFTVGGLEGGQDRILVGPASGSALDEAQFTTDATYTGASVTSIKVSPAIPTDTPTSGTIRIQCDSGIYNRLVYTSYTGDTFTVTPHDFSSDNATSGNNCYISYIDMLTHSTGTQSETFTSVYLSDRSLFIRVRDGGVTPIKTFETTGTLGAAGGSATVIRTPDV
jgi:hypothetical protein